jgi:dolichol-phosphate mannosyltransferase
MRSGSSLAIVVPIYNEAAVLATALRDIHAHARACGLPFTIIAVDDGSVDATWSELQRTAREMKELRAIRLSRNFGKEGAISAGLDAARADAVIVMDADLQHPPGLIPEMVRMWASGECDIVEAIKTHRGREPWWQRAAARTFYRLARVLTGYDLQDASDYKLLDRRVVEAWRRFGERETFFRGLVAWLGFRRARLPFEVAPRAGGRSRWSVRALSALAIRAVTSFSAMPLQIVTLLGAATLCLALAVGVQAIRLWYRGFALPGFTTVILLQLLIGGFLMVSLGIIGTYVARIYEEVKQRPRYVIQEMTDVGDVSAPS